MAASPGRSIQPRVGADEATETPGAKRLAGVEMSTCGVEPNPAKAWPMAKAGIKPSKNSVHAAERSGSESKLCARQGLAPAKYVAIGTFDERMLGIGTRRSAKRPRVQRLCTNIYLE